MYLLFEMKNSSNNKDLSNNKDCVIFKTANFIGKRWTLLIILELSKGSNWKRYSQIKKSMGSITPKMLSARLRELEKEGLIEKKLTTTEVQIRSEYSLTLSGKEFLKVLEQIKKWAIKCKDPKSLCAERECKYCF